jgi:A/G-specific adenine glycosylase
MLSKPLRLMYFNGILVPNFGMRPQNLSSFRRQLLRWYDRHRRDLPWRRTRDPYAIWIAETMLQQTQVNTVRPYYERFLSAFPTVEALAGARLSKVLALWSGLGYYRRAANLKKSAVVLVREHAGRLPDNYAALLALPGVGDYTAGALMSIAFGKSYPALDGNARRVLGRIFEPKNEKELRNIANRLVPLSKPGSFNQGLMELGATICTPHKPCCARCPVASICAARIANALSTRSGSTRQNIFKDVTWPLAIIRRNGKILLRRRPADGILAGLWELPGGEKAKREPIYTFLNRQLRELKGAATREFRIGEIHHSITTRKIRAPIHLFEFHPNAKCRLNRSRWRWLSPSTLRRHPVSSMTLKAAKILSSHEKGSL